MQGNNLREDIDRILVHIDGEKNDQETETKIPAEDSEGSTQATDEVQDMYVLVVREGNVEPGDTRVIESVLPETLSDNLPEYVARFLLSFGILLSLSCIIFQLYLAFYPPTATVTIIPKSQPVAFTGTLHLGRVVAPISLSQSQIVPTTGKGHLDAKQATGTVTFYNGLFTGQTVTRGTILTGSDGVQVMADQEAEIPAGNPPSYGQTTVSAYALNPGARGNIPAYDIDQVCCANAVLAKNTTAFVGGQDERHFQTVAQSDIDTTAIPLKTTLAQSVSGAFQGQLQPNEQVHILPCTPQVSADHQAGEEATQVKVTVSETCSAVAYDQDALQMQAAALLSTQAATKPGTGYSLIGNIQVTVKQATIPNIQTKRVILSFQAQGTWAYAVENAQQQHIKQLIAGKTKQEALQLLASLPGIEKASIHWDDDSKLPKDPSNLHIVLLYGIG